MSLTILLSLLAVAIVVYPVTWRYATHAITLVHELGHAIAGILTRAQVSSIKIHPDSSGVTNSAHHVKMIPISQMITTFWGYPASCATAGLLLAISHNFGAHWAWYLVMALGGLCLVFIRNLFGLLVVGLWIAVAFLPVILGVGRDQFDVPVIVLSVFLFAGGIRDLLNVTKLYLKKRNEGSDIQALRNISGIPAVIWLALMWITSVGAVPVAVWYSIR